MDSTHIPHGAAYDGADRLGGGFFWFVFGLIAAIVALIVNSTLDAVLIGVVQIVSDVEACNEGFSDSLLVTVLALSMVSSVVVGAVLWRIRSGIGAKSEEHDPRWALHLRRWFSFSAIGLFVLASPLKWAMILGMANC